MSEVIFQDFGAEIIKRDGRYFIRYDGGGVVMQMKELPISESDARRAQLSEKDAYQVILAAERTQSAP
jgi:hypothetical protein